MQGQMDSITISLNDVTFQLDSLRREQKNIIELRILIPIQLRHLIPR